MVETVAALKVQSNTRGVRAPTGLMNRWGRAAVFEAQDVSPGDWPRAWPMTRRESGLAFAQ